MAIFNLDGSGTKRVKIQVKQCNEPFAFAQGFDSHLNLAHFEFFYFCFHQHKASLNNNNLTRAVGVYVSLCVCVSL